VLDKSADKSARIVVLVLLVVSRSPQTCRLLHEDPRAEVSEDVCVGVGPMEFKLNVVLTARIHSSVKFVCLLLATRAMVE